jgi:endonuclease YncB( thermonuclease family)
MARLRRVLGHKAAAMMRNMALALTLASVVANVDALAQPAGAGDLVTLSGPAIVREGDSIVVDGNPLFLFGIDAPRLIQPCRLAGEDFACGLEARDALIDLIADRPVECRQVRDTNIRRRMIVYARCTIGELDLGAEMVRAGMAMAFRPQSRDYIALEDQAKAAKHGLWRADRFQPPWEWDDTLKE